VPLQPPFVHVITNYILLDRKQKIQNRIFRSGNQFGRTITYDGILRARELHCLNTRSIDKHFSAKELQKFISFRKNASSIRVVKQKGFA